MIQAASLGKQLCSTNNMNKEGGHKKDERPEERGWDAMLPKRKVGEKQDELDQGRRKREGHM